MSYVLAYEPILDGAAALEDALGRGRHRLLEVVAKHTVFLPPETVTQTTNKALFPIIRRPKDDSRPLGTVVDGVMLDDNTSPTLAFLWAAQRKRGPDVQFNHIYQRPYDPGTYTALWNICVTPAFLAKLTDVHDDVIAALKRRSFDLYRYVPEDEPAPEPPDGYDSLNWHHPPPPVSKLECVLRKRLNRAPKSRPAKACRQTGWYFSDWEPDDTLPRPS